MVARRRWRRYARRALLGMGVGAIGALFVPVAFLYPYFRDDRALDRIVRVVALDWRDFGQAKARTRLEYELDHAGIGMWVTDGDCALTELDERRVSCRWSVLLAIPGVDAVVPLAFESVARIDAAGDLQ